MKRVCVKNSADEELGPPEDKRKGLTLQVGNNSNKREMYETVASFTSAALMQL